MGGKRQKRTNTASRPMATNTTMDSGRRNATGQRFSSGGSCVQLNRCRESYNVLKEQHPSRSGRGSTAWVRAWGQSAHTCTRTHVHTHTHSACHSRCTETPDTTCCLDHRLRRTSRSGDPQEVWLLRPDDQGPGRSGARAGPSYWASALRPAVGLAMLPGLGGTCV